MDAGLKQRLIGAAVLVALAVIFLPMLVKGPAPDSGVSDLSMRVPDAPDGEYRTVDLPLVVPADAPQGGVLGSAEPIDGDPLPTVDTANPPPDAPRAAVEDAPAAAEPVAEPTPPAAEPMRPATTGGGDYVVHFGAFASERDAQLIVRQLSGAGLTAYSEPFRLDGKPAQRVRLGPYASREAAEAVRVRAAQVRGDVTPRVVALDAPAAVPPRPQPQPVATRPVEPATPAEAPKPATTAPAAPTPAAATPTSGGFSVQVGAFGNAAEATKLRDRLRGLGITAFTDTVTTDKGRLTRVKAGPVPDRQDAERLKAQVQAKAGLDGMVRPHP